MLNSEKLVALIPEYRSRLAYHKKIMMACGLDIEVLEDLIKYLDSLDSIYKLENVKDTYKRQIKSDCENIFRIFSNKVIIDTDHISDSHKAYFKDHYESIKPSLVKALQVANFNLEVFNKFDFFDENIVCVGANGSGKTSFAKKLQSFLPHSAMMISAQKLLVIPIFESISNLTSTTEELRLSQTADKSTKAEVSAKHGYVSSTPQVEAIQNEFRVLLNSLIAENSAINYRAIEKHIDGEVFNKPHTRLSRTIEIWNSLISHRNLMCKDGINIGLEDLEGKISYPAYRMSDGEKVILYYIAHVLQAPENGFIVVDEPEMYLHKTLVTKLWNILEKERKDCLFIYITHDLEFAINRMAAKKVWIKSFSYPDQWEIEDIPDNDIPEPLLLELLGSRKRILFCESKNGKGGLDEQLYNLLLPEFTITPVESCSNVINYTKAFNSIRNLSIEAFGLIDSDHQHEERINSLKTDNIYALNVSEIENLLLDEDFLVEFGKRIMFIDESEVILIVNQIKNEVIKELSLQKEQQVANYISAKINYYFEDSHVSKGNTLNQVEKNYQSFIDKIEIEKWYTTRSTEIQKIIDDEDYIQALHVFNNKGLKAKVNTKFEIRDFEKRAINYLKFKPESHRLLLRHLPNELVM